MELTENAVARPDELVVFSDFQSRKDWYYEWHKANCPKTPEEQIDWEPKRRGFVQLWFMIKDKGGQLCLENELVPPEDGINHCAMIRKYYLENGGYFKWLPELKKQFESAGIQLEVPESLTEERSWRLAALDLNHQCRCDRSLELKEI